MNLRATSCTVVQLEGTHCGSVPIGVRRALAALCRFLAFHDVLIPTLHPTSLTFVTAPPALLTRSLCPRISLSSLVNPKMKVRGVQRLRVGAIEFQL